MTLSNTYTYIEKKRKKKVVFLAESVRESMNSVTLRWCEREDIAMRGLGIRHRITGCYLTAYSLAQCVRDAKDSQSHFERTDRTERTGRTERSDTCVVTDVGRAFACTGRSVSA